MAETLISLFLLTNTAALTFLDRQARAEQLPKSDVQQRAEAPGRTHMLTLLPDEPTATLPCALSSQHERHYCIPSRGRCWQSGLGTFTRDCERALASGHLCSGRRAGGV
jgi:hypothetical protein